MRPRKYCGLVAWSVLAAAVGACSPDSGSNNPSSGAESGGAGGQASLPGAGVGGAKFVPPPFTTPATPDGGLNPDEACGSTAVASEVVEEVSPSNLLVLMDRSLSLGANWVAASDAFIGAIAPIADGLTVGAIFFPSQPLGGAVDPINVPPQINFLPGPQFIDAWAASWANGALNLGTPTDLAAAEGDSALNQLAQLNSDPTTVLLMTDGDPTNRPADTNLLIEAFAGRWFNERGIKTYVLGINGISGAPSVAGLDPVAVAGGTGSFIFPGDNALLAQELQSIVSKVVTRSLNDCNIVIAPPDDVDEIFLTVIEASTGMTVQVPMEPQYWELSVDGQRATLLGQFCEDAKNGLYTNVEFKFGCVDVQVIK